MRRLRRRRTWCSRPPASRATTVPGNWAKAETGSAGQLVAREGRSTPEPRSSPASTPREASVSRWACRRRPARDRGLGAALQRRRDPRALARRGAALGTGGRARRVAGSRFHERRAGGRAVVGEVGLRVHAAGSLHEEVRPRAVQPEAGGQFGAAHVRGALRAEDRGAHDPRGVAALEHLDAEQGAVDESSQPRRCCGKAHAHPPAVQRSLVVGVGHPVQPGLRFGAGEAVLHVLGHAAGAGEEVGDRGAPGVGDDLPRGRGDRRVRLRRFRGPALVDLGARVGVDLEVRAAGVRGERVGAARDRLRLERRGRPAGGHLGGDHAAHVAFERNAAHGVAHEHAHDLPARRLADRGAGVVVREDRGVGVAVLSEPERALLAHPHAVSVARRR